jgi:chaperonin GroES
MLKPLNDKVIIEVISEETSTLSGFILTAEEKSQEAIVIAVGTGVTTKNGVHVPIPLEEGQKVIFSKYSGDEVINDGKSYTIISYNDILAVI